MVLGSLCLNRTDDADGVRAEETYANVNSWPDGETVVLEAFGGTDASQIKVELDYYDIEE